MVVVVVVVAMAVCSPVNSPGRHACCTFVSELPRARLCIQYHLQRRGQLR
eukprot:COSAG02_NODE_40823_length_401_cov_0.807947_1_plen_49_part_10